MVNAPVLAATLAAIPLHCWGIDYASIDQGHPPDFDVLEKAGCKFVWIRGVFSYWEFTHNAWICAIDPCMARDWHRVPATMTKGTYVIVCPQATQKPAEVAAILHKAVMDAGGTSNKDFVPCVDVEFPHGIKGTGMTPDEIMTWLRELIAAIKAIFKCPRVIIYSSERVWDQNDTDCLRNPSSSDLTDNPMWVARYLCPTRQPAVLPPPNVVPPAPHAWGTGGHAAHQDQGDALNVPGTTSTNDIDNFHLTKLGDKNAFVGWIQHTLNATGATLMIDGDFGPGTEDAVKTFQTGEGLAATGVVDAATFAPLSWV